MLLKISLGLAILIGLGTLYVTHFQVAPKIGELKTSLTDTQTQLTTANSEASKAKKEAKDLQGKLDIAVKAYSDTTNVLAATYARAEEQTLRANKASTDLAERTKERNEARDELATWKTLGYGIEQMRARLSLVAGLEKERDVLGDENKILNRKLRVSEAELARFTGAIEPEVVLAPGVKGKIVAVDAKYDFVVLDIGEKQGVLSNAKMLVNRDGKLIGKVKITNVEPNRSIANIMPEWKQDDILEGDQVIF